MWLCVGGAQLSNLAVQMVAAAWGGCDIEKVGAAGRTQAYVIGHTNSLRRFWLTIGVGWAILPILLTAAHAWEFSPTPICTLSHTEAQADVAVTYDPLTRLYAIDITTPQGWPDAPAFSIQFSRAATISTNRHSVTGNTLRVADVGFGNVLDGIAAGGTATAFTQTAATRFALDGAAEPVQRFRDCLRAPAV